MAKRKYDVAAYIWPAYTGDEPRTRIFWPEGMGEWQTVKAAGPKFAGHTWPRRPLWGYVNEADPYVTGDGNCRRGGPRRERFYIRLVLVRYAGRFWRTV